MTSAIYDVVIVGGGLTGAATAIHLARSAKKSLRIAIVEPREELGRGLAYANPEFGYRLNGPGSRHSIYPEHLTHFQEWYMAQALDKDDPDAQDQSGFYFPRRYDYGSYVNAEVRKHTAQNASGSRISHIIDRATDIIDEAAKLTVALESGAKVHAKVLVVSATPGRTKIPSFLASHPADKPTFIPDVWDTDQLRQIPKAAEVLILGIAQTASDVAANLLKQEHRGSITMLSRRGKRPRKRPFLQASLYQRARESEPHGQFFGPDLTAKPASKILRLLRLDARTRAGDDNSWVPTMETLSEFIADHWHALPLAVKQRFLRHGKTWYDIHRFRLPPQIENQIEAAETRGQIRFVAASIFSAVPNGERIDISMRERETHEVKTKTYDVVINCTGLEDRPEHMANPFLQALISRGFSAKHPSGSGFNVDTQCNAINVNGHKNPSIFILGPLTYGAFADQQGSVFIVRRLMRVLPDILRQAGAS